MKFVEKYNKIIKYDKVKSLRDVVLIKLTRVV